MLRRRQEEAQRLQGEQQAKASVRRVASGTKSRLKERFGSKGNL